MEAFLRRLHTWTSGKDLENKMVWLNLQCGILPIKFLYSSLFNGQKRHSLIKLFEILRFYQEFSTWKIALGRMLMLDQLKGNGWKMLNKCYMCKGEEEIH